MKTEAKSRPIPFSAPMVRALLDGTKTQTRRVVKFTPGGHVKEPGGHRRWHPADPEASLASPYGAPGDRLWVREEHRTLRFNRDTREAEVEYTEDGSRRTVTVTGKEATLFVKRKFPFAQTRARFMYRSYSRITLEVVSVRVERLNDISEADAKAEGCEPKSFAEFTADQRFLLDWPLMDDARPFANGYAMLWESINGYRSWEANPWVWVVEFKRVEGGSS